MRLLLYILIITFSFSIYAKENIATSPSNNLNKPTTSLENSVKDILNEKRLKDTEEEKKYLKDFKSAYAIFKDQANSFNNEILSQITMEYGEKKKFLKKIYKELTDEMLEDEKIKREQAIEVMERFIKKYPNNRYTPDILFRLADLHFEKTEYLYDAQKNAYEKQMDAYEAKKIAEKPIEPVKNYDKTLEYFKRILNDFPSYKQIAGAYYLTGYIYLQLSLDSENEVEKNYNSEKAKYYFEELVSNYPEGRYTARAYLRIAEYYYNKKPEANKPTTYYKYIALDYYDKALAVKGGDVFDYATYKKAWSFYTIADVINMDAYQQSIKIFSFLIDKYDKDDDDEIKMYREEAIEFIAISFVEGYENNTEVLKKYIEEDIKNAKYGREVLEKVAKAYFDGALWKMSINIYEMIFKYYPLNPENPSLYDYIIAAYLKLGDKEGAIAARDKFLSSFKKGTKWYEENSEDEKAMTILDDLNARYLYDAAAHHYNRAWELKDAGKDEEALKVFELASELYNKYLLEYPLSTNYYEVQYYYAEVLYLTGKFENSIKMFKKVRDNNEKFSHAEDAAKRIIDGYEGLLKEKIAKGELPAILKPKGNELEKLDDIKPLKMAEEYKILIKARDKFVEMFPGNSDAPVYLFKSAYDFYSHLQFEEARKRYFDLIDKYPDTEPARYALEDVYFSYIAENKYDQAEKFYTGIKKNPKYKNLKKEDLASINTLQAASVFKKAEYYTRRKEFDKAALVYLELYKRYPKSENALQSLRNADYSYKSANMPLKRISILKMINKYINNDDKIKNTKKARIEIASNILTISELSERFFDFQMAISYFEKYLKEFPNGGDVKYVYAKLPQLYYNNQDYDIAARRYLTYGPKLDEKNYIVYIYSAIESYKKAQKWNKIIDTYKLFLRKFGNKPKYKAEAIIVNYQIYETYLKLNSKKTAERYLKQTYKLFNKLKKPKDLKSQYGKQYLKAKYLAAKGEFLQVEKLLPFYVKMSVGGRRPLKNIKKKMAFAGKMIKLYDSVFKKYKEPEWAIASFFRKGYLNKQFAEALYAVKAPKGFNEDEIDAYKEQLEEFAEPYEETAEKLYKDAYAYSQKFNINNEWTENLLIELNKIDKETYIIPKKMLSKEEEGMILDIQKTDRYHIIEVEEGDDGEEK